MEPKIKSVITITKKLNVLVYQKGLPSYTKNVSEEEKQFSDKEAILEHAADCEQTFDESDEYWVYRLFYFYKKNNQYRLASEDGIIIYNTLSKMMHWVDNYWIDYYM